MLIDFTMDPEFAAERNTEKIELVAPVRLC